MLGIFLSLRIPAVQNFAVNKATEFLSEKLQTSVSVGTVDYLFFNRIALEKVYVKDLQQDTLLFAESLNAGISIRNLLRNKIVFNEIGLQKMSLRLTADSISGNNFDFILEAFKSDREPKRPLDLRFNSISISESEVRFDNLDRARKDSTLFDVNHLDFKNLNLNISISQLTNDRLSAIINNISFDEQSGFSLRGVQANIDADKSRLALLYFKILLPETRLAIDKIQLDYGNIQNFKHFNDSVTFSFELDESAVSLRDFACFVPKFRNFNQPLFLEGSFAGQVSHLSCPHLSVSYGNNFSMTGQFEFEGLPKIANMQVSAQVRNLRFNDTAIETIISEVQNRHFALSDNFAALGMMRFNGDLHGNADQLLANGSLETRDGMVNADVALGFSDKFHTLHFAGNVGTQGFNLGNLLNNDQFGNIVFGLHVDGSRQLNIPLTMAVKGSISAFDYNGYNFENILLDGQFGNSAFNGSMKLRDKNGDVDFKGLIDFSREAPHYDFFARLKNFAPNKMKLTKGFPDLSLSMLINTIGSTDARGKLTGKSTVDSLVVQKKDEQWRNTLPVILDLTNFSLNEKYANTEKSVVSLQSDFLRGKLEGNFTPAGITADIQNLLAGYLPSLVSSKPAQSQTDIHFNFALYTKDLGAVLDFPVLLKDSSVIAGSYGNQQLALSFNSPHVNYKKINLTDFQIDVSNKGEALQLLLNFDNRKKPEEILAHFSLDLQAQNDALHTILNWEKNNAPYRAELRNKISFTRLQPDALLTDIEIEPSRVLLNDTVWNINQSRVTIMPSRVSVDNFRFESRGHSLLINGTAIKGDEENGIDVQIQDLYLKYLNMFVTTGSVELDGKLSGQITLHNLLGGDFFFTSNINAKDFSFNRSTWGDVSLTGIWDKIEKNIKLDLDVKNREIPVLTGRGTIFPRKDSIELTARANGLDAGFLRPFLDNVIQNFGGEIYTDKLRLFGKTFNPFFDGNVFVKNGNLGVDFLKTNYAFSDSIFIKKDEIRFNNLKITDIEKNKGTVSGYLNHKRWKGFRYNIRIDADNMMVLNTTARDNEMFHGKVFGTGNARITGDMSRVNFDVGLRNGNRSSLIIPLTGYSDVADDFIVFKSRTPVDLLQKEGFFLDKLTYTSSPIEMNVRLQVDANPEATVQLIIDPDAGDAITATGNGNLTMEYSSTGNLRLSGIYTIEQGSYNFTFRDIIRRTFSIRQGSTIQWSGSPYDALLNINAYYSLRTSLADILGNGGVVPVNCVMNITSNMQRPDITFDIELPGSDAEVNRQVRNVISSDDMMNRQMAYLLTIGRFYPPEYLSSANNSLFNSPDAAGFAIASSSISGQLNQWLSQITDSNISFGVNYRPETAGSSMGQEFDVNFSTELLNRRLIFNGNVGYRDNLPGNTNPFVGDFDLEYKLNPSGTLRAKAYSHTNDFYFRQSSPTTQGLGIMYTRQFDTFRSLLDKFFGKTRNKGVD